MSEGETTRTRVCDESGLSHCCLSLSLAVCSLSLTRSLTLVVSLSLVVSPTRCLSHSSVGG